MKIFSLQRGHLYIENGYNQVSFNNAEEYLKYTGKILPNILVLTYEPERDLYVTFNGVSTNDIGGTNPSFDEDIANVVLYKSRKDDPYYGMDLAEERALRITNIVSIVNNNTTALVRAYHHVPNNSDYDITFEVRQQLLDIKSQAEVSENPTSLFPVDVTLNVNAETGVEETATVNTLAAFKGIFLAILDHILTTQRTARALKQSVQSLTDQELRDWVDPRV